MTLECQTIKEKMFSSYLLLVYSLLMNSNSLRSVFGPFLIQNHS